MMNRDSRRNELSSAVAFLYFLSKCQDVFPLEGWKRADGRRVGAERFLIMLSVAQPVNKKLKQKSLLAAECHRLFSWPLGILEAIHWIVLTGCQLNA